MSTIGVRATIISAFIAGAAPVAIQGGARAQLSVSPPLKHWYHAAWAGENGPPLPGPHLLMQSPDGYLWLSAREGLIRFDGVRFSIIDSAVTRALTMKTATTAQFVPELVDREGWLWIRRPDNGLVQYRNGAFRVVREPEADVGAVPTADGAGQIWLSGADAHLRVLRNGLAERPSLPPGVPDSSFTAIVRDTGQGIWIGTATRGLWHVVGSRAEQVPPPDSRQQWIRPVRQSSDGTLWTFAGNRAELYRFVRGQWLPALRLADGTPVAASAVVEDRSHAVWIGTFGQGVLRWRGGALEQFTKKDGLSDIAVNDLFPGDDGSMWIATPSGGLDQFRPTPFVTLDQRGGLPVESPSQFVEDESGSLWGNGQEDQSSVVEVRGGLVDGTSDAVRVARANLPANDRYTVLRGARGGGVWLASARGALVRYRHGTATWWTEQDGLPKKQLWLALETRDSAVWLGTTPEGGFGRLRNGRFSTIALPDDPMARVTGAVEDSRGHLWVSMANAAVVYELVGDGIVRRLGPESGMQRPVMALTLARGDTLWGITGDSGIVRIAGGRAAFIWLPGLLRVLTGRAGLTASESDLWIVGSGVVRLSIASLNAVADGKTGSVDPRVFYASDGISSPRNGGNSPAPVFRARDGRVWITTPDGLAVVDPSRPLVDSTPPRLHVEELSSSGRIIPLDGSPEIAPRPASVSIRYTAISPLAPERTRIQYRLDGADASWIDGVGPRVATYTQLRPGTYTFRLRAWNVDGVPSAHDETLSIHVLPAWYETTWARIAGGVLIALTGAAGAMIVQRRRARRSAEIMRSQFEATLAERTRVAREQHDTLLGDMAGVAMQLSAGARRAEASGGPNAAIVELLSALSTQVQRLLVDARRSVTAMRTAADELPPVHEQLASAAQRTFAETGIAAHVQHMGSPRPYPPTVEAEIVVIATEAMTNARHHAGCRTVTITCSYTPRELHVRVRDDGRGFDPSQATPTGHWGLVGMRKRADSIGAKLAVSSTPRAGTDVVLIVPGGPGRWTWWTRTVPSKHD